MENIALDHYKQLAQSYKQDIHFLNLRIETAAKATQRKKPILRRLFEFLGIGNEAQINEILASGMFDEEWYLEQYPDVKATGMTPVEHYLRVGAQEGKNPSPLLDTYWYLGTNRDVSENGINPLIHYIRFGYAEGRRPREKNFSSKQIVDGEIVRLRQMLEVQTALSQEQQAEIEALKQSRATLVADYQTVLGNVSELKPAKEELVRVVEAKQTQIDELSLTVVSGKIKLNGLEKEREELSQRVIEYQAMCEMLIVPSGFFDPQWYLNQYPDVGYSSLSPLDHYLMIGVKEGRNPSPFFDTNWYLGSYADISDQKINPLVHFVAYGLKEGRQPSDKGVPPELHPFAKEREQFQYSIEALNRAKSELVSENDSLLGHYLSVLEELERQLLLLEKVQLEIETLKQVKLSPETARQVEGLVEEEQKQLSTSGKSIKKEEPRSCTRGKQKQVASNQV